MIPFLYSFQNGFSWNIASKNKHRSPSEIFIELFYSSNIFKCNHWVYAVQGRSVFLHKGSYKPFSVWSIKQPRYFHILRVEVCIIRHFERKNLDQNATLHLVLILIYISLKNESSVRRTSKANIKKAWFTWMEKNQILDTWIWGPQKTPTLSTYQQSGRTTNQSWKPTYTVTAVQRLTSGFNMSSDSIVFSKDLSGKC